jgi:hypothetical protein
VRENRITGRGDKPANLGFQLWNEHRHVPDNRAVPEVIAGSRASIARHPKAGTVVALRR